MNNHKTVNININNQTIGIDEEMANITIALNDLGYKTSGCCIGNKLDDIEDKAWIIIQETDENKIIELMNRFNNCGYILEKQLYKKSVENIIYVQYVLKTPEGGYLFKVSCINDWVDKLIKTTTSPIHAVNYECMEKLFYLK